MSKDQDLLVEAYSKILKEDDSLDQYHRAQLENEASNVRIPLAYKMFERLFDAIPDKDLEECYRALQEFKGKAEYSYRGLKRHPFIKDLFNIIEEQYGYRNQMRADNEQEAAATTPGDNAGNIAEDEDRFDDTGAPR
jgi:hypothetical protein